MLRRLRKDNKSEPQRTPRKREGTESYFAVSINLGVLCDSLKSK
jgi:hypothetical protein